MRAVTPAELAVQFGLEPQERGAANGQTSAGHVGGQGRREAEGTPVLSGTHRLLQRITLATEARYQ